MVPSSSSVPYLPLFGPAADDVAVRRARPAPRLVTLGRLAPRRHRVVALALAFAAAHRVIDGIHHGAAHRGPESLPPHPSGLADGDVLMLQIADLSHRSHALELHLTDLARRALDIGVVAFFRQHLCHGAGAAAELAALTGLALHVVHYRAQ